jgi:hypothetical protein
VTALWIDGVDARAAYGLQLSVSDGARDLPARRLATLTVPQVPGLAMLAEPQIDARTLSLAGFLQGTTAIDVRGKRDRLLAVLRRGRVTLRLADEPTREIPVEITTSRVTAGGAMMLARTLPIQIEAVALSPWWRDTTESTVSLSTTPAAIPLGTAPSLPVLTCSAPGAVLTVTLRDTLGAVVTTLAMAGLEPDVPVVIDCAARTIRQGIASALHTLLSGDFPVLDVVSQGDFAAGAWPTLQVSQGTAVCTYRRAWA